MRHIDNSARRALAAGLEDSRFETHKYQEQLTTGLRIHKPSEDPGAFASASRLRVALAEIDADSTKLQAGESLLRHHDQALEEMTGTSRQMKNLVLRASNKAFNQQVFESMAEEVDNMLEQAVNTANTRVGKGYLFSGSRKTTQPFEVQRSGNGGPIQSVTYQGDSSGPPLSLPGGRSMPLNLNGRDIAQGGGEDFFQVAIELRDALKSGDVDTDDVLRKLESVEDNFLARRGEAASAGAHLSELSTRLTERRFELENQTQELVGIDPAEAAAKYFASENHTQVTMALIGRQNQLSLIDYLR